MAVESEPRKPLYSRPVTRRRGPTFQRRIVLLTLAGGLPALLAAVLLLRDAPIADSVQRLIVVVLVGAWVGFAAGVGTLGIVAFDKVDESNLQRQIVHSTADVGRPKVESAVKRAVDKR